MPDFFRGDDAHGKMDSMDTLLAWLGKVGTIEIVSIVVISYGSFY